MPNQLLIFQKTYDFFLWFFPYINRIPKFHRLILGRRLEKVSLSLLVLVIRANKTSGNERIILQQKISDELDILRILIRLTKDLKFISVKQYALAAEKINEIGRMLTGWMKSV